VPPQLDAAAPVSEWTQEHAWAVTAGSPLPTTDAQRAALLERAAQRQATWREEAAAPQPPPLATTGRGLTSSPQNPARRRPPSASRTPEQEDDLAHALSEMDARVASRRAAERAAVRDAETRHQEQMRIYKARREARLHEQRERVQLRREHTESSARERLLSRMCAKIAAGITGGLYLHADPLVAEAYQRVAARRALRRPKPTGASRRAGSERGGGGGGGCAAVGWVAGGGGGQLGGGGSAVGGRGAALSTAESREAERQVGRRGLRVASAEYAAQLEAAAMVAVRQTPPEELAAEQASSRRPAPPSPRAPRPPQTPPPRSPRTPRTPPRSSRPPSSGGGGGVARGAAASSAARSTTATQHGTELDARLCASPLLVPLKSRFSTPPAASASPRRRARAVADSPRGSTAPPTAARCAMPPATGGSNDGALGATSPRVLLAGRCSFEHGRQSATGGEVGGGPAGATAPAAEAETADPFLAYRCKIVVLPPGHPYLPGGPVRVLVEW